ncbi:hypothetical protein NFI96_006306 [Prochilodus magdalenae]|nr:hypothetical protein NFI96_006306 [Prochilodus magdalenae]
MMKGIEKHSGFAVLVRILVAHAPFFIYLPLLLPGLGHYSISAAAERIMDLNRNVIQLIKNRDAVKSLHLKMEVVQNISRPTVTATVMISIQIRKLTAQTVKIQGQKRIRVLSDSLICKYGEMMFELHGRDKSQHGYISQKMRELGRFMLAVKKLAPSVKHLVDVCVPSRFKLAIAAAKEVSGFDASTNAYSTPSLACKIGYTLKRVCEIVVGNSIMEDDGETREKKLKTSLN